MTDTYIVTFEQDIPQRSKVIVVISQENTTPTGSQLQTGPRLKAQLDFLKSLHCDITVMIPDGLAAMNSSEEEAKLWSKEFIEKNKEALRGCNVVCWDDFINPRMEDFKRLKKILEKEAEKPDFESIINQTFARTKKTDKPKSKIYQICEYASILLMRLEFKLMIYTKRTPGMIRALSRTAFPDIASLNLVIPTLIPATPRSQKNLAEKSRDWPKTHLDSLSFLIKALSTPNNSVSSKKLLLFWLAGFILEKTENPAHRPQLEMLMEEMNTPEAKKNEACELIYHQVMFTYQRDTKLMQDFLDELAKLILLKAEMFKAPCKEKALPSPHTLFSPRSLLAKTQFGIGCGEGKEEKKEESKTEKDETTMKEVFSRQIFK